jgi:hypothetical protein
MGSDPVRPDAAGPQRWFSRLGLTAIILWQG